MEKRRGGGRGREGKEGGRLLGRIEEGTRDGEECLWVVLIHTHGTPQNPLFYILKESTMFANNKLLSPLFEAGSFIKDLKLYSNLKASLPHFQSWDYRCALLSGHFKDPHHGIPNAFFTTAFTPSVQMSRAKPTEALNPVKRISVMPSTFPTAPADHTKPKPHCISSRTQLYLTLGKSLIAPFLLVKVLIYPQELQSSKSHQIVLPTASTILWECSMDARSLALVQRMIWSLAYGIQHKMSIMIYTLH